MAEPAREQCRLFHTVPLCAAFPEGCAGCHVPLYLQAGIDVAVGKTVNAPSVPIDTVLNYTVTL